MKQVVLLLTSRSDLSVMDNIRQIMNDIGSSSDFYVLFNTEASIPEALQPLSERVHCFSSDILYTMGYMPIGDSLVPGSCHFAILNFYLAHPGYDYYWKIEDDVHFSGNWSKLLEHYINDDAGMLSAHIKTMKETPQWDWWYSLNTGGDRIEEEDMVCAFNPICRLSRRALQCVHESLLRGWRGHAEVVVSTILNHNGFSIKDIGGIGRFVPEGEEDLFYTDETHSHIALRPQIIRPDTIYHPVKRKISTRHLRKNCVISAVGRDSLHRHWLENGENRTFDLHLIVYDNSFANYYNDADFLSYKKGFKLKLVYDYLKNNTEYVNHYSYFFIPDDDILTDAKSIDRLFSVMEQYSIKIAQPALKQSYFTYPVTLQAHHFVLRYTNFVEMMLPCFSKEALHKVIDTFNENESGWGTEFHWPLLIETNGRDMAVIDSVPMVHTRPVKRGRNENVNELEAYLKKYSLAPHVKELDFVIENISADSRSKMKVLNERRKVLIKAFAGVVPVLLRKLNMKEISRQGLDGKLSIALYLKLLADFTESVYYKNIAKELFNHIKSRKECSKTLHSFVSGSLGEQWAAYWLQRENSIFKFIKGAIPGNNNELKELETVLDCRIEDLLYVPVSKIMLRVSEYQKNYKPSDNNVMLHSIWGQMHVLYQIEVQMLKLKNVKKNMSLPY